MQRSMLLVAAAAVACRAGNNCPDPDNGPAGTGGTTESKCNDDNLCVWCKSGALPSSCWTCKDGSAVQGNNPTGVTCDKGVNGSSTGTCGSATEPRAAVPQAMNCPTTSASIACGMQVTATAAASCAKVSAEVAARVSGQPGSWHDPHNNGTYTKQSDGSYTRLTGDGKYTDKIIFTLTDAGDSCTIEACSRSQVFSVSDFGTNYCNVKMLYCGSADGCKPVVNDFTTSGETTKKFSSASADMSKCLVV